MRSWGIRLGAALSVPVVGLGIYFAAIRPAQLRWGATAEEVARTMPGDELMIHPSFWATRAITIHARPEQIWPWLAQMGYRRAGFYGYDLIENVGSGTGIRSADRIEAALQDPKTGDVLPLSAVAHLRFGEIAPDRYLIWRSDAEPADGVFTWALYPQGGGTTTRLVSRVRLHYHWGHAWLLALDLFTEFADHAAVPAILRGARDRAEGRQPRSLEAEAATLGVWAILLAETVAAAVCVFLWEVWSRAWVLALAGMLLLLAVVYGYLPAPMGGVLALGVGTAPLWIERRGAVRT